MSVIFDLLGWELKDLPSFSTAPEPLGAILDLSAARRGEAAISNKPTRVKDISSAISGFLENGHASLSGMQRLRGRLIHARAQTFGRFGAAALSELGRLRAHPSSKFLLPASCRQALNRLRTHFLEAPPRKLLAVHSAPPLVFTDGAAEPDERDPTATIVSVGGCILDPLDGAYLWFRGRVPHTIVQLWLSDGFQACHRAGRAIRAIACPACENALAEQALAAIRVVLHRKTTQRFAA